MSYGRYEFFEVLPFAVQQDAKERYHSGKIQPDPVPHSLFLHAKHLEQAFEFAVEEKHKERHKDHSYLESLSLNNHKVTSSTIFYCKSSLISFLTVSTF